MKRSRLYFVLPALCMSCAVPPGADTPLAQSGLAAVSGPKVGVLFSSYGDIDSPDEAEHYVKAAVLDPDIAPIPNLLKPWIAAVGWWVVANKTKAEYERIGGATHYRASSQDQADRVAALLRENGIDAVGYTGFIFVDPYVVDTMARMQADGVEKVLIFNQGAQYSAVTQEINLREARKYLAKHPDWQVEVTAIRSFSDDPRFQALVGDSIQARLDSDFRDVAAASVCIFMPVHGLPTSLPESGDPAIRQMNAVLDAQRVRFPDHRFFIGYQNHDEFPGSHWTLPRDTVAAKSVADAPDCHAVLINGRISFTVDNLETLYDEGVAQKELIEEENPSARVFAERAFNSEPAFVSYISAATQDALQGVGDLERLR